MPTMRKKVGKLPSINTMSDIENEEDIRKREQEERAAKEEALKQ